MSTTIGIIVHERDQEEALKKGKEALHELLNAGRLDCYTTFDTIASVSSDGQHRLPAVILVTDPRAMQFIEDRWQATLNGFMRTYERIKLAIQYLTPEEIMEEATSKNLPEDIENTIEPLYVRSFFYSIGNIEGGYFTFLYFGQKAITKKSHLNSYLTPEKKGLNVYVVPARVEY